MQADQDKPSPAQPAPSKRPRRWPVIVVLVLIVLVAGAAIAWHQLGGKLKSTEPYKLALAQVQKDPQVIAQLGEPIRDAWLPPSGSVDGVNANLTFKIQGPKGRATVQADVRIIAGKWELRLLTVTLADQKRISLNTSSGPGGKVDAPTWKPKSGAAPKAGVEAPKSPQPAAPSPDIQLDMPDTGSPGK